jgi:hypothetical protein
MITLRYKLKADDYIKAQYLSMKIDLSTTILFFWVGFWFCSFIHLQTHHLDSVLGVFPIF